LSDNIASNPGAGAAVRCLSDSGGVEWPAGVVCYATATTPGAATFQFVGTAAGLPVAQQGAWTVTANLGTLAGAALDATLTGGTQKTKLIDSGGANVATVSAGGALKVDASATTQPISGTVTANAGTGTFAVSAASLPLPTGAATEATLAAQSARLPATLDGSGGLKVAVVAGGGTGGTASNFGSAFPAAGTAVGFKDSTGANLAAGNLDASGFLKVNVAAGSGGNGAASATGSAVPAQADYGGVNVAGTLRGWTGVNPTGSVFAGQTDLASYGGATVGAANALHVQPGSGASFAVTGTFWQATQPVSAASLPLPSGAATAAKQPALGAAGSASADVLTIQGVASMTAVKVDGSAVTQPVSGTVNAAQSGTWTVQPGNTANTTAWLVTGAGGTFPATQSGTWNVGTVTTVAAVTAITNALPAGTNAIGTVGFTDATPAGTGTISAADAASTTTAGPSGQSILAGTPTANSTVTFTLAGDSAFRLQVTGTFAATLAIEASSDGGTTWVSKGGFVAGTTYTTATTATPAVIEGIAAGINRLRVRCTAYTSGTPAVALYVSPGVGEVKVENPVRLFDAVSGALGTIKAASTAVAAGDTALAVGLHPTSPLPAGTNTIGAVTHAAATTGGATPFRYLGVAGANQDATAVKASAGTLYMIAATNVNAAVRFLKFYDLASGATSASTPVLTLAVPGATTGAGIVVPLPVGLAFGTGISLRLTTGMADNDANAITSGDVAVSLAYK
jgi:hypothetical protein